MAHHAIKTPSQYRDVKEQRKQIRKDEKVEADSMLFRSKFVDGQNTEKE